MGNTNGVVGKKIPGTKFVRKSAPRDSVGQHGHIKLFYGTSAKKLCNEVGKYLGVTPGDYERKVFSNENIFIQLKESVRGQDVYLIQTMGSPLHVSIMEMLIMIDALKRDSAGRINVVIPYFPYGRSDKKDQPRVPITARLVANMIETAGADRYMTIDLHAGQIQGFFNIPGDALTAFYLMSDYMKEKNVKNLAVVTTDLGFAKKGRNWAEKLGVPLAFVEKRRVDNAENPEALTVIGDVKGKNVLLVDDEVNTAGTVVKAVEAVRECGARDIYLAFTHAILSKEGVKNLKKLHLKEIITTNTHPSAKKTAKKLLNMKVLSVAPLLAEVIVRAHEGRSVGELFNE